jgi:hypothetical protein
MYKITSLNFMLRTKNTTPVKPGIENHKCMPEEVCIQQLGFVHTVVTQN